MKRHPNLDIVEFANYLKENGVDATMKKYGMGRKTVQRLCELYHIQYPLRGRKPIVLGSEQEKWIEDYRKKANIGYQKLSRISMRYDEGISEWTMRKYYDNNERYLFKHTPDPVNQHTKRFVAKFAGQTWHTDLHYLKKQKNEDEQLYLIAFIDDRTRKILHHGILDDKAGLTVANALVQALQKAPKPRYMVIDNGKEFIGLNFQRVLEEHDILEHRIHVYTPEENGKIERWWQTLERCATQPLVEPYLSFLVGEYNGKWDHLGLKELTGKHMTPDEAWNSMEHWENQPESSLGYEYSK